MNVGAPVSTSQRADHDREHFDEIAEHYSGKDLVPSSRCARRLRLAHLIGRVPLRSSWRVLEVGCGAGFAATYLRGRYRAYVGIDHSRELIKAARRENSGPDTEFIWTSIADYQDREGFDLVFMVGVLHHLDQRSEALQEIRQMLRPGGYLAVNEPQPSNPIVSLARRIRASLDTTYSDDQDEIGFNEMYRLLDAAGFTGIEITPQGWFSTPFAEVPVRPDWLALPVARAACRADKFIDGTLPVVMKSLSWNLSAVAQRPELRRAEQRDGACDRT